MVEKKDAHAYVMDLYKSVGDDPRVTALGCECVFEDALKMKERVQELLPAVLTWTGASWAKNREKADLELSKFQAHFLEFAGLRPCVVCQRGGQEKFE